MTKNQLNCIACLILGMGFMVISYLMAMSVKTPLWMSKCMTIIALGHIVFAGIFRRDQKYDENGKPL